MSRMTVVAVLLLSFVTLGSAQSIGLSVADGENTYALSIDGHVWMRSPASLRVCQKGNDLALAFQGVKAASGADTLGKWSGQQVTYGSGDVSQVVTLKQYDASKGVASLTASFPSGLDASGCTSKSILNSAPAFNMTAELADSLSFVTWKGTALSDTPSSKGLSGLKAGGLDNGPLVAVQSDSSNGGLTGLVWSTMNSHKIVISDSSHAGIYGMGVTSNIANIPPGFNYSVLFATTAGGPTAAMYNWGNIIREYSNTSRIPSVTLTDIGYYTDDGAYYYVWEAFNIPARPWPAEVGLLLVKEQLYKMGVPVAYMQLDDWWYNGPFYFGNVKAVVDWHASNSSRLFPSGLPAFADKLDLPLQLYTPFWSDKYQTPYNMTESTKFKGTKLVTPKDSYHFFADLFDFGNKQTNNRFKAYEIDFLDANFAGSSSMFEDVNSADMWYAGMADAALEHGIAIQYCLPSATDMMVSLTFPAVVQARASGDYVNFESNAQDLGGSSLMMGAVHIAPSKDTLWTKSPQPATSSDKEHSGYTTQPHVQLDAVLATLSLGPVGISDGLGQTDAGLISQAFMSSSDSTLLRPSRPLSWVDSFLLRKQTTEDVRSTHAEVQGMTSHYVVAWRTGSSVTLNATDLYPQPPSKKLAVRTHDLSNGTSGCAAGKPASPSCVKFLESGTLPTIAATGTDISDLSLTVIYEPLANGAFFLGEMNKFIHVAPQRFNLVSAGGTGPAGVTVSCRGSANEELTLWAVTPSGDLSQVTHKFTSASTATIQL